MTTMMKLVTYKGRSYRLLWSGETKFGRRAKLSFMDGSKEFWADLALVSDGPAKSTPGAYPERRPGRGSLRGKWTGCAYGSIEGEYRPWYCESCRFDELDQ